MIDRRIYIKRAIRNFKYADRMLDETIYKFRSLQLLTARTRTVLLFGRRIIQAKNFAYVKIRILRLYCKMHL